MICRPRNTQAETPAPRENLFAPQRDTMACNECEPHTGLGLPHSQTLALTELEMLSQQTGKETPQAGSSSHLRPVLKSKSKELQGQAEGPLALSHQSLTVDPLVFSVTGISWVQACLI